MVPVRRSAASEGALHGDILLALVLVEQVGLVGPDEVPLVVRGDQLDRAGRVAGGADVHAERAERLQRVAALVEQLDDGLVALDRVADHLVAGDLGARDGALVGGGAGVVGHVGVLLRALAVVLEGRTVGGVRRGRVALGVDVGERRDAVRVGDRRQGVGGRRVVHVLRRRVLRAADVRVALGSLGAVRLRERVEVHQAKREDDDGCGCDEPLVRLHDEAP